MKHYKYFICIILFISCKGEPAWKSTEAEVIDLHDEVMPHIGLMKRQQRELQQIDPAQTGDDELISQAHRDLVKGDSLMWWWMEQYVRTDLLVDSLSDEEIERYLQRQKIFVTEVNHSMKHAMKQADALLEKYKQN